MKIKKLGHCCLLIEEQGKRILTDPGAFSTAQNEVKDIDVVLITHEHGDHLHVESLKAVLKNNPGARVITNNGVAKILDEEGIKYEVVADGQSVDVGIVISGHGKDHAPIYPTVRSVENTSYFIGERLFFPGDAFYKPTKPVELLAVPISAPWMKVSEGIDYAKEIKPKKCFPVHDGILIPALQQAVQRTTKGGLEGTGIEFVPLFEGEEIEL